MVCYALPGFSQFLPRHIQLWNGCSGPVRKSNCGLTESIANALVSNTL